MEHKIQEEKGHKTRLERWAEARSGGLLASVRLLNFILNARKSHRIILSKDC